jgi:hypothetical protein
VTVRTRNEIRGTLVYSLAAPSHQPWLAQFCERAQRRAPFGRGAPPGERAACYLALDFEFGQSGYSKASLKVRDTGSGMGPPPPTGPPPPPSEGRIFYSEAQVRRRLQDEAWAAGAVAAAAAAAAVAEEEAAAEAQAVAWFAARPGGKHGAN